jgi:hypothetical protein
MLRNQVGISNGLTSLLYSHSSGQIITSRTPSAEIITSRTLVSSLDAMTMKCHFSIINAAVQCHILRTFEEKNKKKIFIPIMAVIFKREKRN